MMTELCVSNSGCGSQSRLVAEVQELEGNPDIRLFEKGDGRLEVVAFLT